MLAGLQCKCGKRLKLPESSIGKAGRCPVCQAPLRLVAPQYSPTAAACDTRLEITTGPDRVGEVILLAGDGPIEVGRLPEKHLVLSGHSVSRAHGRLIRIDSGWRIEDQKSTSGLFVNGKRVDAVDLRNHDEIRVGDYHMTFVCWNRLQESFTPAPFVPFDTQPEPAPEEAVAVRSELDAAAPATADVEGDAEAAPLGAGLDDDSLYRLSEGDVVEVERPEAQVASVVVPTGGPTCPSCGRALAPSAKICVQCGVNLKTGRAIITAQDTDLDSVYTNSESVIWWISWLIRFGFYPVTSEAFGIRKPYYIRAIAVLTIFISAWFWAYDASGSPKMRSLKNYMHWSGNLEPTAEDIADYYEYTSYGDSEAFHRKYNALVEKRVRQQAAQAKLEKASKKTNTERRTTPEPSGAQKGAQTPQARTDRANTNLQTPQQPAKAKQKTGQPVPGQGGASENRRGDADSSEEDEAEDSSTAEQIEADADLEEDEADFDEMDADLIVAAHKALPPEQQYQGRFSAYQLVTHAFLHGDIFHLAGNLLFLLVIGSRVNALVGNLSMIVLYPLLAVLASVVSMAAEAPHPPMPSLGASGAIMGLAGMYLVLMPVHKMHVAAWFRWPFFLRRWHLSLWLFPVRGFWVLLFFIAFDVLAVALAAEDGVGHWAHLGGFMTGIAVGLLLLFTRVVNCRGGDIVSALLGKHAWSLIGKPDLNRKALLEYGC